MIAKLALLMLFAGPPAHVIAPSMPLSVDLPVEMVSRGGKLVAVVSHIRWIRLKFTAVRLGPSVAAHQAPVPIFEVTGADSLGLPVQVRSRTAGFSGTGSHVVVTVEVEIPVAAEERSKIISAYVDKVTTESKGKIREALLQQREKSIAALTPLFMQSQTGDFSLRVCLHDPLVAPGDAEVPVSVISKGTFADEICQRAGIARK